MAIISIWAKSQIYAFRGKLQRISEEGEGSSEL